MLFKAQFKKRTPFEDFIEVSKRLFLRDCAQKFGEYKLGVLWALVEPIVHILTFTLMLSRSAQTHDDLIHIPMFVMSGLIPFLLFRNTIKGVMTACKTNKAAFFFPKVKPLHAVASKVWFECFVYTLSFVVIFSTLQYFSYAPDEPLNAVMLLGAVLFIIAIGLGLGLIAMVLREFVPSIEKWINILLRPLYFLSSIFYSVSVIPKQYHFVFEYNPCVHVIEFTRHAMLGQEPVFASWFYLGEFALLTNFVGFTLFAIYKDKLRSK
ncbi:ABC transporter permease [Vibrio sp. D431a]|uniref:ABC transporter permease n=1 Tax=Vibrio sp. D431a TaxID=2837388 RepID=UPI002554C8E7|nr:ABC transporter permease [Vibrio sp. D431a]MDK9790730.1 ABC transporter permease [Vibrio sp. D431a]